MMDIADELRRYSRKIAHPAGDVPSVMLKAADDIERLRAENAKLHARIAEMEKQEPVGEIRRANSTGNYINPVVWVPMAVGAKLYAGPGAKGE